MDRIENRRRTVTHVLTERLESVVTADGTRRGRTLCGRTIHGYTGACIVPLIDCRSCKKALRSRGWDV